jgi:magnesium chelatase subunit D
MGGGPVSRVSFPLSAVVGHDDAKLALVLNALDRRIGGVLLRGQKGSAKSTLARGLAALIGPDSPFVELPVSATEDRVVGTLDIESALVAGARRFQPGLLADADGGVLYVDEINLLPDHLVDVLLDVATSGVNRVERDGVSEAHASRFVLIGSMNPEEGDLRPQLLDRFGLAVDVTTTLDPHERAEAVSRRLAFDADPDGAAARWAGAEAATAARLAQPATAAVAPELLTRISALCAAVGAEGLRADIVICRAAAALAAWEGRGEAGIDDVRRVAPLALAHRRRRSPLDDPGIDQDEIDRALDQPDPESSDDGGTPPGGQQDPAPIGEPTRVVRLAEDRSAAPEAAAGRRSVVEGRRGRVVADRKPDGPVSDVAVGASLRAAASRHVDNGSAPARVERRDLREAVREQRAGNLIVLAVDASASMAAESRMGAVKGAVVSLLLDAYQRRDRVALVTFAGDGADVALRPTGSVEVARARLAELRTGGRTPLASGIDAALALAQRASPSHRPLLVVVSDGRATAGPEGVDPVVAAMAAAGRVARHRVPAVVVDVEDGPTRLGLARELAVAMGARHLALPALSAGALADGIRQAVGL